MKLPGQILRFGCVGAAAALVHLAVVWLLVLAGSHPLLANAGGFAASYQVSYAGHRSWTFRTSGGRRVYLRLLAASLASFAANESGYAALLAFTPLDYRAALLLVLAGVAAGTFLLARLWVFRGEGDAT